MPLSSIPKSLLTTCVLTTLVFSSVEGYQCVNCSTYTCSTNPQTTCETSQSCFSYKQELRTSGQLLQFFEEKGCSSSSCVPLVLSASLGDNHTFGYKRQCCQDELCNRGELQVPQKFPNPNGIKCPACYNEDDISCEPVLLTCTGAETKCLTVIGQAGPFLAVFAMGCATETACNLKNTRLLNNIKLHTYCVESNGTPQVTSITSSILTGLFLLKVLL
ncbi:protein RoBo-1-like isoform X1 [Delphinus delphis]|uniref:protein RoBo-1-like isoform X1 n=1 Tax=Delphinus delphis TaxID=9728 RepID=UPI0028C4F4A3|nr:protein RoBo-1-like isoform X1 [Delphinus delphis]